MSYCQDCKNIIEENQPMIQCPRCGSTYHEECWNKNGGCVADGCGYQVNAPQAAPVAPANQYHCYQCGTALQDGQFVCPTCGVPRRRSAVSFCPRCGAEITGVQQFCGKCGAPLQAEVPAYQQPYGQPVAPAKPKTPALGLSIPGMILGILSLVFCWVPIYNLLLMAIPGLILSIIAKKKGGTGMATAGIVCSAIGLGIGLIFTIAILATAAYW